MGSKKMSCHFLDHAIAISSDGLNSLCCSLDTNHIDIEKLKITKDTSNFKELFEYNPLAKKIEQTLAAGSFPRECIACEKREKSGLRSNRLNPRNETTKDKSLNFIYLELGNTCNLQCLYCGPTFSTSWKKDSDLLKQFNIDISRARHDDWLNNEKLWSYLIDKINKATSTVAIEVVGGEPFLSPYHNPFIDKLIRNNLTQKVSLTYSTNFTQLTSQQIDSLKKFKDVELLLSIDTLDVKKYEYIRYPAKLDQVIENFKAAHSHGLRVRPFITIHALNLPDIAHVIKWSRELGIAPAYNIVHYPNYFHPLVTSETLRNQVIDQIRALDFSRSDQLIKNLQGPQDQKGLKTLKMYLTQIDIRRKSDFVTTFEHIHE